MKRILIITLGLSVAGMLATHAADAKENWVKNCQKCHGATGDGHTTMGRILKIKDYTDAKVQAAMKDDEMFKTIKEGKKEGDHQKMKAFGDVFSDDEIKALVKYVRSLKK